MPLSSMDQQPIVRSGQVRALRLFDIAYEVDLRRAEELWQRQSKAVTKRGRLTGTPQKAVSFGVPPLELDLGDLELSIAGTPRLFLASVRLYDFGIAAIALRLPVRDMPWRGFVQCVNQVDLAVGPNTNTDIWPTLLDQLRDRLGDALTRPTTAPLQEDYLIGLVDSFDTPMTADALLSGVDLTALLSGEEGTLSEPAQRDLLARRFSYRPDDLAIITWDRAFIYEPRQDTDVIDVLEMANAQLLEIRTYDEMLDEELPRMRALVEAARSRIHLLAARRYARLARRLYSLVGEVSELAERVDNALQVTEDVFLARVYAAAIDLFRVPTVSAAVDRKLAIIRDTYTALHSEAAGARAELLEIVILILIAVEIVLSVVRH